MIPGDAKRQKVTMVDGSWGREAVKKYPLYGPMASFTTGMFAAQVAAVFTNPIDVVKVGASSREKRGRGREKNNMPINSTTLAFPTTRIGVSWSYDS